MERLTKSNFDMETNSTKFTGVLKSGITLYLALEKLKEYEDMEERAEKSARWKIISNNHSSYFQCMNCFATIHEDFASEYKQKNWIEENPYCRKCGTKMKGD